MTNPKTPYHFEVELEVPGTPDEVWQAIATADGIASWMMHVDLEAHEGGAVTFHMRCSPRSVLAVVRRATTEPAT